MSRRAPRTLTRRTALSMGAALVSAELLGCGDDASTEAGPSAGGGGSGAGAGASSAGGSGGIGAGGVATGGAGGSPSPGGWASGGTASMTDKDSYPDPFTEPLGSACTLTPAATLGPCYAETLEREDISEGQPGLPMRLAFLVVDTECNPVPGATVDVWHNNNEGLYSGDDSVAMCTSNDPEALAARWFRGTQTTGPDGKAFFDSCFPGWYPGRAIHVHYQVRIGDQAYVTSQLFFPASRTEEIFATHPEYSSFGQPDTPNSADGIYFASGEAVTSQLSDGALMASQVLVVPT